MANEHKAEAEQRARRIAEWLSENREDFEGEGIGEDKLAAALGISDMEMAEAVDHLEAREEVVRMPRALTTPPQFVLKPGRGWPEMRDEISGKSDG